MIRPSVDQMLKSEDLIRAARRGVIKAPHPTPEPIRLAVCAMLDDAISHLVAARAALNTDHTSVPAEPASA